MILKEYYLEPSYHWVERINDRFKNTTLVLPNNIYQPNEDKKDIIKFISPFIFNRLGKQFQEFLSGSDPKPNTFYINIIAEVKIRRNNKLYEPTIIGQGSKDKGFVYYAITKDNKLYTLILTDNNNYTSILQKVKQHTNREYKDFNGDYVLREIKNNLIVFDLDVLLSIKNKPIIKDRPTQEKDVPYKVREDYRKTSKDYPSFFDHSKYGRGEIIESRAGGLLSAGRWEYIKVDFKGLKKTFENLYTKAYFRRVKKEEVSLIKQIIKETSF